MGTVAGFPIGVWGKALAKKICAFLALQNTSGQF